MTGGLWLHWISVVVCFGFGTSAIWDPKSYGRYAGALLLLWTLERVLTGLGYSI